MRISEEKLRTLINDEIMSLNESYVEKATEYVEAVRKLHDGLWRFTIEVAAMFPAPSLIPLRVEQHIKEALREARNELSKAKQQLNSAKQHEESPKPSVE